MTIMKTLTAATAAAALMAGAGFSQSLSAGGSAGADVSGSATSAASAGKSAVNGSAKANGQGSAYAAADDDGDSSVKTKTKFKSNTRLNASADGDELYEDATDEAEELTAEAKQKVNGAAQYGQDTAARARITVGNDIAADATAKADISKATADAAAALEGRSVVTSDAQTVGTIEKINFTANGEQLIEVEVADGYEIEGTDIEGDSILLRASSISDANGDLQLELSSDEFRAALNALARTQGKAAIRIN